MCICWSYGSINRLQIFSLSNPSSVKTEFYLQSTPKELKFSGSFVEVLGLDDKGQDILETYNEETGELSKMINIPGGWAGDCVVQYPLCFGCNQQEQLQICTLEAAAGIIAR